MKILITSGGTKVKIDPVRFITNMSNGTFGCKIAAEALNQGHEVFFFHADKSKHPLLFEANLEDNIYSIEKKLRDRSEWAHNVRGRLKSKSYKTYDDYKNLFYYIEEFKPDVVILAAAVSDYITDATTEKVKSSSQLKIELRPAEKIISKIKEKFPNVFLVGFKLLVGASDNELIDAARKSIENNQCDVVIANDYNKLASGNHEILVVKKDSCVTHKTNLAQEVIKCATSY